MATNESRAARPWEIIARQGEWLDFTLAEWVEGYRRRRRGVDAVTELRAILHAVNWCRHNLESPGDQASSEDAAVFRFLGALDDALCDVLDELDKRPALA